MCSLLLVVDLVLRKHGAALDHVGRLITDYLGPSRNLPLSEACQIGSTPLLDRIWECSPTSATNRSSTWSLLNYLRSDPIYYRYQFRQSVVVAAKKGDLRVLAWLLENFSGCRVPMAVVETATLEGRLDVLQLLVKYDAALGGAGAPSPKKRRTGTGSERVSDRGERHDGNTVRWGGESLVFAACKKHYHIVRFLYENTPRHAYAGTFRRVIAYILDDGEIGLAEELLPAGKTILDYGEYSANPVVVERAYAAGLLDDEMHASIAVEKLARSGRLDLMKKIWKRHEQQSSLGDWMQDWVLGMAAACQTRDLAVLSWMVEHTSGRAAIAYLKEYHRVPWLLNDAARLNHLDVMQYLHDQGAAVDYGGALLCAKRKNNMDAVTWLVENFPPSEKIPQYCVLVEAARYGRVEMLEYLQSSKSLDVPGFPGSNRSSTPRSYTEFSFAICDAVDNRRLTKQNHLPLNKSAWRPTDAMDDAATNGQLEAVKWLHENRSEGCTTKAMDEAAANGHFEVLEWLHANRPEGCTTSAMDNAAANGRLDVVEWLRANRSEGFSEMAIFHAACYEHTEVVKWLILQCPAMAKKFDMEFIIRNGNLSLLRWLYANAKVGCSVKAMVCAAKSGRLEILEFLYPRRPRGFSLKSCARVTQEALSHGHCQVAYWCLRHFPAFSPKAMKISSSTTFESLIFALVHYPEWFTPANVALIRQDELVEDVWTHRQVARYPRFVIACRSTPGTQVNISYTINFRCVGWPCQGS